MASATGGIGVGLRQGSQCLGAQKSGTNRVCCARYPQTRVGSARAKLKVTEKDVQYVAELANLELTPEESSRMLRDMNSILGHIDKLNELDTSDVEPMTQVM